MESNPFIIAEAGSCHEETLTRAIQLIHVAQAAKANAVKFQYWSNPSRMRSRRHIPEPSGNYDTGSIQKEWIPYLKQVCNTSNILFACSVYLPEDVETLNKYIDVWKISSFEAGDEELRDEVLRVKKDRPCFISTGMQTGYTYYSDMISLHCVSAYPCPLEEANLSVIEPGEGYSDHTRYTLTGGFAVMAGANYLEVHFRLDSTSPSCSDYIVALPPMALHSYIDIARKAYMMRGSGSKSPMPSERENMKYRVET